MSLDIGKAKASEPRAGVLPNPKLKLLDQVSEVMRFKHYSLRTERTYQEWIKRFIFFHGKRHPREMGAFGALRCAGIMPMSKGCNRRSSRPSDWPASPNPLVDTAS